MDNFYLVFYIINLDIEDENQKTLVRGVKQLATLLSLLAEAPELYVIEEVQNLGYIENANDLIADLTKNSFPEDLDTGNFIVN